MPSDIVNRSTVHVGLDYSQVIPATVCLAGQPVMHLRVEGDGWQVWGEKVGTNGNDEYTFHVQMETTDPLQTLFALLGVGAQLRKLGSEGWATKDDVVAVITDADDHDLDVIEMTGAELARGLSTFLDRLRR